MANTGVLIGGVFFGAMLAGCAGAPAGMRYANPNCVFRCVVEVVDAGVAPKLATLTATLGATASTTTTGGDTTTTETTTRSK